MTTKRVAKVTVKHNEAKVLPMRHATSVPEAPALVLAFAPLHKRAFGMAIGSAVGVFFFGLTAIHLLRNPAPENAMNLRLLAEFFYGYEPSWTGAFIGLFWGFIVGFVAGWFLAFCRNLVIAISIFITRTRAELGQTRDFLDHI